VHRRGRDTGLAQVSTSTGEVVKPADSRGRWAGWGPRRCHRLRDGCWKRLRPCVGVGHLLELALRRLQHHVADLRSAEASQLTQRTRLRKVDTANFSRLIKRIMQPVCIT
jgi:hypothetical protein